jgi:hypothetical protein
MWAQIQLLLRPRASLSLVSLGGSVRLLSARCPVLGVARLMFQTPSGPGYCAGVRLAPGPWPRIVREIATTHRLILRMPTPALLASKGRPLRPCFHHPRIGGVILTENPSIENRHRPTVASGRLNRYRSPLRDIDQNPRLALPHFGLRIRDIHGS